MKRWTKRLLFATGVCVLVFLIAAGIAWRLSHQMPVFYRTTTLSDPQFYEAAQRVEQKLVLLQNAAAQARADETMARQHAATLPNEQLIDFQISEDELNAFFQKWSVWPGVRAGYSQFLNQPYIALTDNTFILAGQLHDIDSVLSAHFMPNIDPDGRLRMTLSRLSAGRLPIPVSVFSSYRSQGIDAVQRHMPAWKAKASIDPTGVANSSMVSLVMGKLLLASLNDAPADPVFFLPLARKGCIAARIISVRIEKQELFLQVQPLTPAERQALVNQVKN